MTADMQDIHDVFKALLVYSPELAPSEDLRELILRLAAILADMLGRIQVLESQSEADLKTVLEKAEALHDSDRAPYQLQLDNLLTFAQESDTRITNHFDDHRRLDIPTLIARFNDLKDRVDVECERLHAHETDQADLNLHDLRADLGNLAVLARTERERLDNHSEDHAQLELNSVPERLDTLNAKFNSLAPLLPLLPLPARAGAAQLAKKDEPS